MLAFLRNYGGGVRESRMRLLSPLRIYGRQIAASSDCGLAAGQLDVRLDKPPLHRMYPPGALILIDGERARADSPVMFMRHSCSYPGSLLRLARN